MISEPELVGGTGFDGAEILTEAAPPDGPRPPRARRPWLWALAGAVLASAVWGGGLYAYGRQDAPGPDLRGYQPVEDLCSKAPLKALAAELGARSSDGTGPYLDTPALSESSCTATFGPPETGQSVDVTYTVHKVTDPGPEFAARAEKYGLLRPVDGLGEQAFFDDRGEEGGTLRILDGQVEIELSIWAVTVSVDGVELEKPARDLSGIEVPMTRDALALMAALRK